MTGSSVSQPAVSPPALANATPGRSLARVRTDEAAVVLVVDLAGRRIVQANRLAETLAPTLALPADVDAWFEAAGLGELPAQDHSVARRSALRVPVPRLPLGAADPGGHRTDQSMLVVELALEEAPGLAGHALVLLVPLREGQASDASMAPPRAVVANTCSYTLADPLADDQPLTWVSPAFEAVTGYSSAEAVGRNCRFLQGPDTAPAELDQLRCALRDGQDSTVVLLNYRRDGTAFWNQVAVSALRGPDGATTQFVGVQTDVTERVESDRARTAALVAERAAREDAERALEQARQAQDRAELAVTAAKQAQYEAERAQAFAERAHGEARMLSRHMSVVAEATGLLGATLNVDESLDRLARLAVPLLADWVVINLTDDYGRLGPAAFVRHRDGHQPALDRYRQLVPAGVGPGGPLHDVLNGGPPILLANYTPPSPDSLSPEQREIRELSIQFGACSVMLVPLKARSRVLGTMMFVHGPSERTFTFNDLDLAADLGRRAGLAVDNARMYTREHQTALALQRGLLPQLTAVPGLALAASYVPAGQDSQVGGDWWDVLSLPDGTTGLAIGDVMGHGLSAAAAMGQLRSVLRTCAWAGDRPATVLERMDQLVQNFDMAQLATCIYARLERIDGREGRRRSPRLSWSNAGHLPPVCLSPDGRAVLLTDAASVPIGVPLAERRHSRTVSLSRGTTLLLYTDGLVETRAGDIDSDLERLLTQVARHSPDDGPATLVERLHAEQGELSDDVAMLAVQLL